MARTSGRPVPIIVHVTVHLPLREARALTEACRRFDFETARYLLRFAKNARVDDLCEAITNLSRALDMALSNVNAGDV